MTYFTLYRLKPNAGNQAQPVRRQELSEPGPGGPFGTLPDKTPVRTQACADSVAVAEARRTHSVGNLSLLQVYCGDTRSGTRARLVETIVDEGPSWTVCGVTLDGAGVEETYYELHHACVRAQGIQEDGGGSAMVMDQDGALVDYWDGYQVAVVESGARDSAALMLGRHIAGTSHV